MAFQEIETWSIKINKTEKTFSYKRLKNFDKKENSKTKDENCYLTYVLSLKIGSRLYYEI